MTLAPYYADRQVRIYHGDSRVIMPELLAIESNADVTITDPPYDAKTHRAGALPRGKRLAFSELDDVDRVVCDMLRFTRRWCLAFCTLEQLGAYQHAAGESWVRAGVWHRLGHAPQLSGDRPAQACDGVAIMHPRGAGRMRWLGGGHGAFWAATRADLGPDRHPAEKPLDLMKALVAQFSFPDDKVLDPYMGSGTTLRACKDLGRQAVGIEQDERWCEVAARKMSQECLPLSA